MMDWLHPHFLFLVCVKISGKARIHHTSHANHGTTANEIGRDTQKRNRYCSDTVHRSHQMKLQLLAAVAFAGGCPGDAFVRPSKLTSRRLQVEPSRAIGRALEGRRVAARGLSMKSQATPVKTDVSLTSVCVRCRLK